MTERGHTAQHRSKDEIARASGIEYGEFEGTVGTSMPAILRLLNYKGARSHNPDFDDPRWHDLHITDIHHIQVKYLYDVLGVSAAASIIDVGCGDGSGLLNHAMNYNHVGNLVGVNLSAASYFYGELRAREWAQELIRKSALENREVEIPDIEFVQGNAMDLPESLKQGKFHVAKLDFILYHLPDPQRAIDEALGALSEDGYLVVSTRGEENMETFWNKNLPEIGELLGASPPSTFYADYTSDQLKQDMQERGLECIASHSQNEPIHITLARLEDYALSHSILNNHFTLHQPLDLGDGRLRTTPTFKMVSSAVDEVVVNPAIRKMAEDPDYFIEDKVDQMFRIYRRTKKTNAARRKITLPNGAI